MNWQRQWEQHLESLVEQSETMEEWLNRPYVYVEEIRTAERRNEEWEELKSHYPEFYGDTK